MKGLLGLLKVIVVGYALYEGGKALQRNKDRLRSGWKDFGGTAALKSYTEDLSLPKLLGSIGPLRDLAGQFARLKQSV